MKLSNDLIGKKVVDLQYKNIQPDYEYEIITAIGETQHLTKTKYKERDISNEYPKPNGAYDRYEFYEEPKKKRKLVKKTLYSSVFKFPDNEYVVGGQLFFTKQGALNAESKNPIVGVQEVYYEGFEDAE